MNTTPTGHVITMDESDDGWRAICECGWESRRFRADDYDVPDPADMAYDFADIAGQTHQEETRCADCLQSLTDPQIHCRECGGHMDGVGVCQDCGTEYQP